MVLFLFSPPALLGSEPIQKRESRSVEDLYNMGYLRSLLGHYEEAIRQDPDFGNPYNDIGVYLMKLAREDEAVPYLEMAMRAKK